MHVEMNEQMHQINKQMMLVINEKDHQIKVMEIIPQKFKLGLL